MRDLLVAKKLALPLLLLLIINLSTALVPPDTRIRGCENFLDFLTRTAVQYSASYFADNPRGNGTSLDPGMVDPPTPAALFKAFYGTTATPANFKEALLQMYYADPGPFGPADDQDRNLIQLRSNIYTYAQASSWQLARRKFGVLVYLGLTDLASASRDWVRLRCLRKEYVKLAETFVVTELEKIRNEIGEFRFGRFLDLGSGTTLAFVVDDTGSMDGEIEAAKERAKMILRQRQGSLDQAQDFVLVPFNDPEVGPLTVTNNQDVFTAAIESLYAHDGGDTPELAMRGISLAVENSRFGSTIFVITDAEAKDIELQDLVVAQAKRKNIKITFLLTRNINKVMCSGRSPGPVGSLGYRRCNTPSFKFGRELYNYLAESTGGNVLVVSKASFFSATEVIDSTIKQGVVDISFEVLSSGETRNFAVPVDTALTEMFFQFLGSCRDITITHNGEILPLKDTVSLGNFYEGKILVGDKYGDWMVNVTAQKTCTVKTVARSTEGFLLTLAKQTTVIGETAVYETFEGQPLFSDQVTLLLNIYGGNKLGRVRAVKLISKDTGMVVRTFKVTANPPPEFRIPIVRPPTDPVLVLVEGTDLSGVAYSRVMTTTIEFVHVSIQCSDIKTTVFRPGDSIRLNLAITNTAEKATSLQLGVSDTQEYVSGAVTPSSVTLAANGGTAEASFGVTAPEKALAGSVTLITISAKSNTSNSLLYKTCELVVGQLERPRVGTFTVKAKINSRFAETIMTSLVQNDADVSRKADFYVLLPKDAFITAFSMTVDGETYDGTIREKEEAKRIFNLARERDLTAGHVAARDTSNSVFKTSVNLAPRKTVTFVLTYQELLQRKLGKFLYDVTVRMLQPVDFFSIEVSICETEVIESVQVLGFETDQTAVAGPIEVPGVSVSKHRSTAEIRYSPSVTQQEAISPFGLNGKFSVEYSLTLSRKKGDFVLAGSYFAHFINPEGLPIPKRVVFALDISGSMYGHKMDQVRSAMASILANLGALDAFGILVFNGTVTPWEPAGPNVTMVPVTPENVGKANKFLAEIRPRGGTNIQAALYQAILTLREYVKKGIAGTALGGPLGFLPAADMILLLTDGRPNIGITNPRTIEKGVYILNNNSFAINTVGFGSLVDMKSLKKIAAQNKGFSTQVFMDIDAHVQIATFFESISNPILTDVVVEYERDKLIETTETTFPAYYAGGELIISGQMQTDDVTIVARPRHRRQVSQDTISYSVKGRTRTTEKVYTEDIQPRSIGVCDDEDKVMNFTQRLHVFMQLKHLLRQIDATTNKTIEENLKKIALNRSLQFDFVTPGITSMIVLKPEDIKELEEALTTTAAPTTTPIAFTSVPGRPFGDRGFSLGGMVGTLGPSFALEARPVTVDFVPLIARPPPSIARPPVSGSSRDRMVIAGDPHILVDLNENIAICFNWHGKDREMYNIIADEASGVFVNVKLLDVPGASNKAKPSFLGEVGIVLTKHNMTIFVSPRYLVVNIGNRNVLQLLSNQTMSRLRGGVKFEVKIISKRSSLFTITVDMSLQFQVFAKFRLSKRTFRDHLDFSVSNNKGLSKAAGGVLGQFPRRARTVALDLKPNSRTATLKMRSHATQVVNHTMYDTYTKEQVSCWFVSNLFEITAHNQTEYQVKEIFSHKK